MALLAAGSGSEMKPGHSGRLSIASAVLALRFRHLSQKADLEEAVRLGRAALAASEAGWKDEAATRVNLASLLSLRYEHLGRLADLDDAIEVLSGETQGITPTADQRAGVLDALAMAQFRRFEASDEPDSSLLDLAIKNSYEAVETIPVGHSNRTALLSNFATILRTRVSLLRLSTSKSADELRRAWQVASTAPKHRFLSTVGRRLRKAFSENNEEDELQQIIEIARAVVDLTPAGYADRSLALISLANAYFARFHHTPTKSDLDLAIELGDEALHTAPPNHTIRAGILLDQSKAFETRFDLANDRSDARAALRGYREAAEIGTASAEHQLAAACAWGVLAASIGEWNTAVEGYAKAVACLDRLAWRGLERADQRRVLKAWSGLASEAAICAIGAEQVDRGIGLLEQGRAVMWSQALDSRRHIERLNRRAPALAYELMRLESRLSELASGVGFTEADSRMSAAREREIVVDKVRAMDGFEDFQRPPSLQSLTAVGEMGPIVLLVDSIHGCSAIIVSQSVKIVPLDFDAASGGSLRERIDVYEYAQQEFAELSQSGSNLCTEEAVAEWRIRMSANQARISDILQWLWDAIASPVLDAFDLSDRKMDDVLPRIWWCPTGRLALLPIHAAGYHSERRGRTVLDHVVSSYTPTIRALDQSRLKIRSRACGADVLVVALRYTPGQPELPMVEQEADYLKSILGNSAIMLNDTEATLATVRDALGRHAAVHFACHGHQDLDDPSKSGVELYDGRLTIADLGYHEGQHAEFAFLSSCDTAVVDRGTPDEVITLTTALQYSGFKHVIGTLGPVVDRSASQIARHVYSNLVDRNGISIENSAIVLHEAVRVARDDAPTTPSAWSTIIHAGP